MGKMHKEIAKFLTQSAENENVADEDIIKVGNFLYHTGYDCCYCKHVTNDMLFSQD